MKLEQPDPESMEGRSVIVTGAGSGIGRALALGFCRDGAAVVGVDQDEERLAALGEVGVRTVTGDVTDPATLVAAVTAALELRGRVDVLFNNAGFGSRGRVDSQPIERFRDVVAVHLFASYAGIQAVCPAMQRQRHGRIVNVLSRAAEACLPTNSAYSAGKAALWALTRSAAAELAPDGILVNGLIPGMTNTAIWGRDRPELQPPEAVYPTALALATLRDDGPTGRVFWDLEEYPLFEWTIGRGVLLAANGDGSGE